MYLCTHILKSLCVCTNVRMNMYVHIYMYACIHTHKWKHTYHVYLHMYIVIHIQMCVVPNTDFNRNWQSVTCPQTCLRPFWEHILTAFSNLNPSNEFSSCIALMSQNLIHFWVRIWFIDNWFFTMAWTHKSKSQSL